jgi:hypothetical protein
VASEMMFRAELNPLQLPEAEIEPQALTLEIALQFLCARIAQDAIEAFRAAVRLVVSVVGQESRDGKMVLQPALVRFLQKKGLIVSAPPPDTPA